MTLFSPKGDISSPYQAKAKAREKAKSGVKRMCVKHTTGIHQRVFSFGANIGIYIFELDKTILRFNVKIISIL